jgi:hypothetical protein
MSKTAISQYSATPSSNSDVDGIDISEGCPASNLNNAQRSLMSHLKEMDDGTSALTSPSMGQLNVDNLRLDGNTISSTDTNGNVTIDPDGTGDTIIASGNVGIGSSPDTNLDVERSSNDTGGIKVQNTNNAQASAVAQVEISGGDNAYANLLLECNATNHSIRQDGSGNLKFINASTERLRIDSGGDVKVLNSGRLVSEAGIFLGGTSSANLLDDYEEGTWTPTDISGASLSFTSVNATYVKIGKTVFVAGRLTYPSTANTNQARIAGFPFTSENTSPGIEYPIPMTVATSTTAGVAIVLGVNNTAAYIRTRDHSVPTNASMSGNTLIFSGSYNTT